MTANHSISLAITDRRYRYVVLDEMLIADRPKNCPIANTDMKERFRVMNVNLM